MVGCDSQLRGRLRNVRDSQVVRDCIELVSSEEEEDDNGGDDRRCEAVSRCSGEVGQRHRVWRVAGRTKAGDPQAGSCTMWSCPARVEDREVSLGCERSSRGWPVAFRETSLVETEILGSYKTLHCPRGWKLSSKQMFSDIA